MNRVAWEWRCFTFYMRFTVSFCYCWWFVLTRVLSTPLWGVYPPPPHIWRHPLAMHYQNPSSRVTILSLIWVAHFCSDFWGLKFHQISNSTTNHTFALTLLISGWNPGVDFLLVCHLLYAMSASIIWTSNGVEFCCLCYRVAWSLDSLSAVSARGTIHDWHHFSVTWPLSFTTVHHNNWHLFIVIIIISVGAEWALGGKTFLPENVYAK